MREPRKIPFPQWLDRVRRADARRWAEMSPEEVALDIHQRSRKSPEEGKPGPGLGRISRRVRVA